MSGEGIEGLYRVCVKLYASENRVEDDAECFVPIFHDWIRDGVLDLVVLDVADYAHAPDSPGIMLVCHEVSFSLDRGDGRFGILAQRRTPFDGSATQAISWTTQQLLDVAARLERDPRIAGKLKFDPTAVRVEANDRLLAPNSEEGWTAFSPLVVDGVRAAYGSDLGEAKRVENDPRDRLAGRVELPVVPELQELAAGLTPITPRSSV